MKYIAIVFLLLLQRLIAEDAAPSVSVPKSLSPCSTVPLEINGGTPPYSVSILNAVNPTGPVLKEFQDVRQPSNLSWGANLPAGTVITFTVKDSKGLTASSGPSSFMAKCPTANPDQSAITPSGFFNNLDDAVPRLVSNNTVDNGSNNSGNSANSGPISPADGASNLTGTYAPENGTQATTVPHIPPIVSYDGSANQTNSSMSLTNSSTNTTSPDNFTTTSMNNMTIPNFPASNIIQSQSSSFNINHNNNNQTAKPPANQKSTSSKGLSISIYSVLLLSVIILSTWT